MERRASAGAAVIGTSKRTPRCPVRVVAGLTKPPATVATNALRMRAMTDTSSCHAASWRPVSGIRRDSEKYGFAQYGSAQYGFAQENSLARRRLPALRVSSW